VRRLLRTAGVLAATLAALGTLTRAQVAEPPMSVPDLTVVSWNICGEAGGQRGEDGYCPHRDEPAKKIDQVAQLVEERDADVAMLQEVCGGEAGSHMDLLQRSLGSAWTIRHAAGARPDGRTDCRSPLTGELGVLIAVKGTITSSVAEDTLPDSPDDARTSPVLCVTVAGWAITPCVAHLIPDEDDRAAEQARNVKEFLAEHAPGDLVLGGDLNRNRAAAALAPLTSTYETCLDAYTYHGWNNTTQERTWHKLDHFLVSRPSFGAQAADCAVDSSRMDTTANEADSGDPSGYSDHAPIIGTFRGPPVPGARGWNAIVLIS
jgi:endonuclease/exonuclease/phosphatase family metal-dependent hydrolase